MESDVHLITKKTVTDRKLLKSGTIAAFGDHTIHTYHTEGAGELNEHLILVSL